MSGKAAQTERGVEPLTAVVIISDAKVPASVSVVAADRENVTAQIRQIATDKETRWGFVQAGSGQDVNYLVAAHERQLQELGVI